MMAAMARARRLLHLVLWLLALSLVYGQQPVPPPPAIVGTGVISGVVLDGTTNAPLAGVVVYLGPPNRQQVGQPLRELTDAQGRFVFTDLGPQPDGYFINASKFGYIDGHYGKGAGGALGSRIFIAEGEWFGNARIVMSRPCAISGTVTDERGDAVVGAYVRVLLEVLVSGRPHLATGPVTRTDDRGIYRLANLAPGNYLVSVPAVGAAIPTAGPQAPIAPLPPGATPPAPDLAMDLDGMTRLVIGRYPMPARTADGRLQVYAATFYPAASFIPDAQAVEVKNGEDRQGIDVHLQAASTARIAGVVNGPAEAMNGLTLRLMAAGAEELGTGGETATALVAADGSFTFPAVPDGSYTIQARRMVSEFRFEHNLVGAPPTLSLPSAPGMQPGRSGSSFVPSGPENLYVHYEAPQGSGAYWGRTHVDVAGRDVAGVAVTMQRAVTISGRAVTDTSPSVSATPAPASVRSAIGLIATAEPSGGDISLGVPRSTPDRADPTAFAIEGLMPGQYFLRFNAGPGTLKSIVWDGHDMTYTPFDASLGQDFTHVVVTFTDQRVVLAGTVRDAQGQAVKDAVVIAFPVERDQWTAYGLNPLRMRPNPVGTNGAFHYQSLPAGDYFVVGVDPAQSDAWKDPRFLEAAAAVATKVTLVWGETTTVDVKMIQMHVR
jgi:hypothetical protein